MFLLCLGVLVPYFPSVECKINENKGTFRLERLDLKDFLPCWWLHHLFNEDQQS